MAFVRRKNKDSNQFDHEKLEGELINLLDFGDNKDVLSLNTVHKSLLRKMTHIKADVFNEKEILDLIGWGMISLYLEDTRFGRNSYYHLTPYGYAVAAYLKERNRRKIKAHDLLALKFARQKENGGLLPFLDIELKGDSGVCRPDVFVIKPTYNEAMIKPTAYEVKVSRADFLSDMAKPEKWKAYLDVADALYYICPEGLIDKKEMPKECGLIYYDKKLNSFDIKKQAKKFPKKISQSNMMRLLLNTKKNNETILVSRPFRKKT